MSTRYHSQYYRVVNNDIVHWAKTYQGEKYHAILCDPPYEISFMSSKWDQTGVTFQPETWYEIKKRLYPGAFGMAFSSARTYHRLACALEDAGFILHPSIYGWVYSSGFPKASNISKYIDKQAGVSQKVIGEYVAPDGRKRGIDRGIRGNKYGAGENNWDDYKPVLEPATPMAKVWEKHRYGLQALKPALEPILVFQNPYEGKPLQSIQTYGAGALNIDDARIRYEEGGDSASNPSLRTHINGGNGDNIISHEENRRVVIPNKNGRWPANFYVDGYAAEQLDTQSGITSSIKNKTSDNRKTNYYTAGNIKADGYSGERNEHNSYSDSGGASRFFFQVQEQIDQSDPVHYCAKPSRKERDAGLEHLPKLHRDTSVSRATQVLGLENTNGRGSHSGPGHNPHVTIKPLQLCKYLATILLPPDYYAPRRILVPFSGVSSEMIGALQAGFEFAMGIELEELYCHIARTRLQHYLY